ncbi:104aa long hypothetical protein [Pyrococcus horikoshii OT3]|uniref:Uncharacterized protein n=1 Tax=Pyrococcus horikoshii (strain ATCC 700860 / DSM 12428 / JCM 9974 / NBRC 100139 / OT-3) TaxID=70601 RepID=O59569_PYRHO|nr:104aa long hypothetical protein [Pyrococcus horikoshii OT3]
MRIASPSIFGLSLIMTPFTLNSLRTLSRSSHFRSLSSRFKCLFSPFSPYSIPLIWICILSRASLPNSFSISASISLHSSSVLHFPLFLAWAWAKSIAGKTNSSS